MSDLLISFYGDDLTGSTDAMEALTLAGVRTALFLQPASAEQVARLSCGGALQAVGLAGTSRSETPEWMDAHLPAAFGWLRGLGAPICHYKVCSTFDSAPAVGSIGRALDIGRRVFDQAAVPVVVGVPQLKRYTVFGQHFATVDGVTYRLDRHPVMSRHPVTPMDEADLARHLARQTAAPVGLVDCLALQAEDADARVDAALQAPNGAVVFDVPDLVTQVHVGRQLWRLCGRAAPPFPLPLSRERARGEDPQPGTASGLFVVGSSGVEYALVPHWRELGLISDQAPALPPVGAVDRIAAVSGSCSAITAAQITHAGEQADFALIAVDAARLASRSQGDTEQARALAAGCAALDQGRSVIAHTALGPDSFSEPAADAEPHAIGRRLGRLLRDLVAHGGLRRAVVAGGDTSSHALRELGVHALTVALPLPRTPGSPLCTAHSDTAGFDGLQVALKGGQVGAADYFEAIRLGRP